MNFWSVTLNVNYEIRKIHRKKREKITSHKENTSHPPPPCISNGLSINIKLDKNLSIK